jgi:hypothetical protein
VRCLLRHRRTCLVRRGYREVPKVQVVRPQSAPQVPPLRCASVGMTNQHGGTRVDLWGPSQLEGEACGVPHLAKNERDVGHPAVGAGIDPKGEAVRFRQVACWG